MASSVAFKPIDPKRDEFRRYLERAGVIEALTKLIIRLVKERPQNPLEYLRTNLGDAKQEADEYSYLQKELEDARTEIERLRKIIENVSPEALLEKQPTAKTVPIIEKESTTTKEITSKEENASKVVSEPNIQESEDNKPEEPSENVDLGADPDAHQ